MAHVDIPSLLCGYHHRHRMSPALAMTPNIGLYIREPRAGPRSDLSIAELYVHTDGRLQPESSPLLVSLPNNNQPSRQDRILECRADTPTSVAESKILNIRLAS
jgi:hypothetical protein